MHEPVGTRPSVIVDNDRTFAADAPISPGAATSPPMSRMRAAGAAAARIRRPHQTDEDTTMQDDDHNPAASTTQDIKAAARDMLRMGSRWAHSALDWIDERRHR